MLSIEKALGIYTDKLNAGEKIDLNYFKNNLSKEDYKEFLDLIEFVKLAKAPKKTETFKNMFSVIDKKKNEYYGDGKEQASGFRKCSKDKKSKDVEDKLEKIFDEEFGEDE